jgi:hypothetical protein
VDLGNTLALKKILETIFRVLGVSFDLILLGVFLAYSSLGAGSNERTQTPLGAHQRRF